MRCTEEAIENDIYTLLALPAPDASNPPLYHSSYWPGSISYRFSLGSKPVASFILLSTFFKLDSASSRLLCKTDNSMTASLHTYNSSSLVAHSLALEILICHIYCAKSTALLGVWQKQSAFALSVRTQINTNAQQKD